MSPRTYPTFMKRIFSMPSMRESIGTVTLLTAGDLPPGEGDLWRMLTVAMDGILDLCGADRGLLRFTIQGDGGSFELARSNSRSTLPLRDFKAVADRLESGAGTAEFWPSSPDAFGVPRASVLLPVMGDRVHGVLYIDRVGQEASFDPYNLWPLEWFAQMAGVEGAPGRPRRWRWRCLNVGFRFNRQVA